MNILYAHCTTVFLHYTVCPLVYQIIVKCPNRKLRIKSSKTSSLPYRFSRLVFCFASQLKNNAF